jgi:EAL domain-containing protein (putative c-di-GMP-specific phosphodiesterase class I)/DNA-binding NarL/FixJ family response regulator
MNISELNVLIVEDDEFQRQTMLSMLRSMGVASVAVAGNGREALDILRKESGAGVGVVLCDLKMPEMDGMEFLRHLGQERREVAVVITSALDGKLLSSVGRMTTMQGITLLGSIEKPVTLARLKDVLSGDVHREDDMALPVDSEHMSLDAILQGIEGNQFEPFFQPKVDLRSGRLVGAEALARWRHPDQGVIGPYGFIEKLERSGNIDGLTFAMLEKSAAMCRTLHDLGHILTISVNLSLVSLADPALADGITKIVRKAGIDPAYIVLEITESAAMTDVALALENLARLCMNGFILSIDDFGTGYSSLQQLTRIAFGELKIDRSFVKDCADSEALRIVVASSVEMAHKLGVKSVAEGVETQKDWEMLASTGCDTAQGYFIAKPMDTTAFIEFVDRFDLRSFSVPSSLALKPVENKVLVVDDDSFSRKLIVRILRNLGYANIDEADSAELALKLFEIHTFDLIVCDVGMPKVNGLKLVQMIRAGKTLAKPDTRVVILTSFSQSEILGAALALDINGFLSKPIIPAVIEEKLAKALSERFNVRPPLAYDAVRTELRHLVKSEKAPPDASRGASVVLGNSKVKTGGDARLAHRVSLHGLRAGMTLKESIHLADGTLLLSAGHVFTEPSINRLKDIKAMLKEAYVSVQDAPATGPPP